MTTRARKFGLMAATGLSVAMISMPAFAQDATATAAPEPTAAEKAATAKAVAESSEVIIVRGVRGSMKDSASKKRKAKQISDSVSAEDAGKLPDNNVTEALAHLTGVQIQRQHGEGTDIAIRGIQEVGTTVNGNAVGGGNMRSLNHNAENGGTCTIAMIAGQCNDQGPTLSDVPAALIKSVTVYKTRTADQVEGGIGGVVNVELRRPLDLAMGWTIAGSYRLSDSSIGNTLSPFGSLLIANRFDTKFGEMGFLFNLGFEQNRYQEDHLVTETVQSFYSPGTITTAAGDTMAASGSPYLTAYRVWDGTQKGTRSRPTANIGYQWRPTDNLDFVLEGTWLGSRETSENDYASLKTSGDGNPNYTDLVTQSDGVTVKSMTVNTATGGNNRYLEFISAYWKNKSDTFTTNFETHYHTDKLQLNGSIQYNWSHYYSNSIYQDITVDGIDSASVDFNDNGKPSISLSNSDALSDVSNYNMLNFHQGTDNSFSRDFNGQLDLTYEVSDTFPIRSIQAGIRQSSHFSRYYTAYRDASISSNSLADFGGGSIPVVYSGLSGSGIAGFYHLDNASLLNNWDSVLGYIASNGASDNWTTTEPDDKDNNSYAEKEFTFAWYGQFNYAFNAYFPVDGVIGVRVVDTNGQSESTWFHDAYTTSAGVAVAAVRGDAISAGTYRDVLPSYNATIHFRKDLQLRLAYTYMVQRPAFSQLAGGVHLSYDASGNVSSGWGGNPDLQPMKGPNYDASLEYYFGQGGVISFAAYLKKPEHQILYYSVENKSFPELGVTVPTYWSYFNAGQGTYQGYEFNAQSFFEFLPGYWKHFGAGFNYTFNQIYKLQYPSELEAYGYVANHAPWTSRDTYNIQLFYDTPTFNARIAYNYRSKYLSDINADHPEYTYTNDATSRLDASLSWTPVKNWTFTVDGTNLLNNNQVGYYGYSYFPAEVRLQARTFQVGARFRY
jgi:iron complex outermembrane receptor protein